MEGATRSRFALAAVCVALVTAVAPLSALADTVADEQRLVDLINSERRSAGLGPLVVLDQLVAGARDHAQTMADAGEIFHRDDLGSLADGWYMMGENVGMGGNIDGLHGAFMDSQGHRDNILKPQYDSVGVGVVWEGGIPFVVEVFMDSIQPPLVVQFTPPFSDDDGSIHEADIIALYERGITKGCASGRYCPDQAMTRAEMATMLVRAFDLSATAGGQAFTDIGESVHRSAIQTLASTGITQGCGPTTYCPDRSVTRAEMATFLVRVLELAQSAPAGFDDTSGSVHAENIDALAGAGITRGCTETSYCPDRAVTRAQMASFLIRATS